MDCSAPDSAATTPARALSSCYFDFMAVARSLCNRCLPPLGSLGGTGHTTMFHIWHWKGSGWLCIFGLGLAMLTEVVLRAVTHDLTITAPRSWWLMAGYA